MIVLFVICSLLISGFVVGSVVGGIGVAVVAIIVIILLRKRRRGKNICFYKNYNRLIVRKKINIFINCNAITIFDFNNLGASDTNEDSETANSETNTDSA